MNKIHELRKNRRARALIVKKAQAARMDQRRILVRVESDQGLQNKFMNLSTIISKKGVYSIMTPLNYMTGTFEVVAHALDVFKELAKAEGLQVVRV